MIAIHQRLLDRLLADPAFETVATSTHLPLTGQDLVNSITIEGQPASAEGEGPAAGIRGMVSAALLVYTVCKEDACR